MTDDFITNLPKAELHLHIEGSLEPELMFALAERNKVAIPFKSVEDVRAAYSFTNLQTFLDIYYAGAAVLQTEEDFHDLALAYFDRVAQDGVVHAEIFFDPQTHTHRGIPFDVVANGLFAGIDAARAKHGMSIGLIMSYLRGRPARLYPRSARHPARRPDRSRQSCARGSGAGRAARARGDDADRVPAFERRAAQRRPD